MGRKHFIPKYRLHDPTDKELQTIHDAACGYRDLLQDRVFLVAYGSGTKAGLVEIGFQAGNFAHLMGIEYDYRHVKPRDILKAALRENANLSYLGPCLSDYFYKKASAVEKLVDFASVVSDVSLVNHGTSNINADIWLSNGQMDFALGAAKMNTKQVSSIYYAPSSLQLLDAREIKEKSDGDLLPISVVLTRKSTDMRYGEFNYIDEQRAYDNSDYLKFALQTYCDEVALREKYPNISSLILDRNDYEQDLEHFAERVEAASRESDLINARRHEIEQNLTK